MVTNCTEDDHETQPQDENYCPHYKRSSCILHFKCCEDGKYFPCHKCHNEAIEDGNHHHNTQVGFSGIAVNYGHPTATCHDVVFFQCTKCNKLFDSSQLNEKCINCTEKLALYACKKCKILVNDKSLDPFHCEDCGACRVNKSKTFHCSKCNICLDKKMKNNHKCLENSGHDTCGVCMEDVFSGCKILPCSHKLHEQCLENLIVHGIITCPNCRQCFVPDETNKDQPSLLKRILVSIFCRFF